MKSLISTKRQSFIGRKNLPTTNGYNGQSIDDKKNEMREYLDRQCILANQAKRYIMREKQNFTPRNYYENL